MLPLAHAGLTLGAALLINVALSKRTCAKATACPSEDDSRSGLTILFPRRRFSIPAGAWLLSLSNRVDIRLLFIGSLLSDMIDKPVGRIFFRETFHDSGYIMGHSLLFLIVIIVAGLWVFRVHRSTWLLGISFGVFTHLILDMMWWYPQTLLWPAYGISKLGRYDADLWVWKEGNTLYQVSESTLMCVIPEVLGGAIIAWFFWELARRKAIYRFFSHGLIR
ncbi:MAG: metal-dependent hydrolase [Dehalococcoidia bacterium]